MLLLPTRAGLVALFLSLCIALAACAPVAILSPSITSHNQLAFRRMNTISSPPQRLRTSSFDGASQVDNTSDVHDKLTIAFTVGDELNICRRQVDATVVLIRRKSIGQKIKDAFHHLGQKIKHGFQKVGHAIKSGFQKAGHAIKTAAHKVGHFFKETGKKIAKVALKVAAVATKAVSKVVGFIPGIGKVAGKAMEAGSKGLNAASNAIKCKVGGKLGTAMHRMDKGMKVMSYIP